MTYPWGRAWAGVGVLFAMALGALLPAACEKETTTNAVSSSGAGGADAGCYSGPPRPLFVVTMSAAIGSLPPDTTVTVKWSAGQEPDFVLNEPATWLSLEDGSNVVCDVDADAGMPSERMQLRCELWTSGATHVRVSSASLPTHEQTLIPVEVPGCDEPAPQEVDIVLGAVSDAGARG